MKKYRFINRKELDDLLEYADSHVEPEGSNIQEHQKESLEETAYNVDFVTEFEKYFGKEIDEKTFNLIKENKELQEANVFNSLPDSFYTLYSHFFVEEGVSELHPQISISEYSHILQIEYIQFTWAAKNYPEEFVSKYNRMCEDTEDAIKEISEKTGELTIFDDSKIYDEYENLVFKDSGEPDFYYRTPDAKTKMHHHNLRVFYNKGKIVSLTNYPSTEKFEIVHVFTELNKCLVHSLDYNTKFSVDFRFITNI